MGCPCISALWRRRKASLNFTSENFLTRWRVSFFFLNSSCGPLEKSSYKFISPIFHDSCLLVAYFRNVFSSPIINKLQSCLMAIIMFESMLPYDKALLHDLNYYLQTKNILLKCSFGEVFISCPKMNFTES